MTLIDAIGKDGNGISSYQAKVQRPVKCSVSTTDLALEEQVANREASWEIDSKASFSSPGSIGFNHQWYTNPSKFITFAVIGKWYLCSVIHAATPVVTLASKRIVRLSRDMTEWSKDAGLPKTQFGTKRSAGWVWL